MNTYKRTPTRIFGRLICWVAAVWAAGIIWLPALAVAQDRTVVRMTPLAQVNGDRILLAQVADISGPDPVLRDRLGRIDIGRAPLPGRKMVIESRHILARMQKNSGGLPADLGLEIPERLEVSRAAEMISKEKIEKIAVDWVLDRVPWDLENVNVRQVRVNTDIVLPRGKVAHTVKHAGVLDFLNTIALSIEFTVDGQLAKRAWVTVNLEVIAPVVVVRSFAPASAAA